jgi:hypothetical protein
MGIILGLLASSFIVGTVLKDRKDYFDYYGKRNS